MILILVILITFYVVSKTKEEAVIKMYNLLKEKNVI